MKLLTVLGLALALAVAAMAVAGAPAATALELCKAAEASCSEANVDKEGTAIVATASEVKLESSAGTIACKSSALEGETAAEAGAPLPMFVNGLSFSSCSMGETGCTISTLNLPNYALLEETGKEKANLSITSGGPGSPSATFKCGALTCTMGNTSLTLAFEGGAPATLTAAKVLLKKVSGLFCPAEAFWSATYKFNSPEQQRLASRNTVLCVAAPMGGSCPMNSGFNGALEGELLAGTQAKLAKASTPFTPAVTCTEEDMAGNFAEAGGGTVSALKFETAGPCSSNFNEDPTVTVLVEGFNFASSRITYRSASRALLVVAGANVPKIKFTIEHPAPTTCKYRVTRPSWEIYAYNPLKMKSLWRGVAEAGSAAECPAQLAVTSEARVIKAGGGNIWVLNS